MNSSTDNFKFFVPADFIEKAGKEGESPKMVIKGLASTGSEDSDEEMLDAEGFDLSDFAYFNWNHGKTPGAIIGEPTNWDITQKGLMVEGELYPEQPSALEVWQLGKALKDSKRGNKLGFSVEGKVLQRDPINKKRITKAKITQIAVCPHPKNGDTWVDFLQKGHTSNEEWEYGSETQETSTVGSQDILIDLTDESGNHITLDKNFNIRIVKKAVSVESESGKAISKESIDGQKRNLDTTNKDFNFGKSFNKSELFESIFRKAPSIQIEKAKLIYKIAEKMSGEKQFNEQYITKALDYFQNIGESLEKGGSEFYDKDTRKRSEQDSAADGSQTEGAKESGRQKLLSKAVDACKGYMKKEMEKSEIVKAMKEAGYDDETIDKAYQSAAQAEKSEPSTPIVESNNEGLGEIQKSIQSLVDNQKEAFQNIGVISKGLKDGQDELLQKSKDLDERIKALEEQPVGGKAKVISKGHTPRPEEEELNKSQQDDLNKSHSTVNIDNAEHKQKLVKVLSDSVDLRKGEVGDEQKVLLDDLCKFETGGKVTESILKASKSMGIKLVSNKK